MAHCTVGDTDRDLVHILVRGPGPVRNGTYGSGPGLRIRMDFFSYDFLDPGGKNTI
jgi:hypothetical protein